MTIDEFKKNIAPYMKKGWVAYRVDFFKRGWVFFKERPELVDAMIGIGIKYIFWHGDYEPLDMFDIESVDNWKESLIEVGNAR